MLDGAGEPGDGGAPPPLARRPRWMATTDVGEQRLLDDVADTSVDGAAVRAMAAVIARRLSVRPRRRRDPVTTRGSGPLFSVPYRYGSDDIDLDRTLEVLAERPVPEDTDIIVRERMRGRQAVVLMIDVSGSMRGEKVRIAAATVAALARDLAHDELAVVAFWKDAVLAKPMGPCEGSERILEAVLRIPTKGLTNVEFALRTGLAELSRARSRRRRGILLSDVVHNAGPDPRPVAARFPRLDVFVETDGEHDAELASELARMGRGEMMAVADHRAVAEALNRIFAR